jgi:hypothetical protein
MMAAAGGGMSPAVQANDGGGRFYVPLRGGTMEELLRP